MKTVKTIQQHSTTYAIYQLGNRTFRISFVSPTSNRVQPILSSFDSLDAAEEYIALFESSNKFIAMGYSKL